MPYPKAHLFVAALLALTIAAFWPSYLSKLPDGKSAWHVHALGAVLWTMLLGVQSWLIHSGRRELHRSVGLASFALFPLFLVGGMMAIQAEATTLAAGLNAPENKVIAQFGFFDPLANIGFAFLFHQALAHRRNIQLHARYMVATVLFLVSPLIWRLLQANTVFFNSDTPDTAYRFSYAMAAGNIGAIALAWLLYRQAPRLGRPYLIVIGFIAAQQVLFETLGRVDGWGWIFSRIAFADPIILNAATGLISIAIAWHGWNKGKGPVTKSKPSVSNALA